MKLEKMQKSNKRILFVPHVKTLSLLKESFTVDQIKNEPMIFNGNLDFCIKNGGFITSHVLKELERQNVFKETILKDYDFIVDTKSVMVMKGEYPSIPGWHCDFVSRNTKDGQPDIDEENKNIKHFLVFFSNSKDGKNEQVTGTEFVTTPQNIDVDTKNVWRSVNSHCDNF